MKTRLEVRDVAPPAPSAAAVRAAQLGMVQRWLDELGRAPTAEEILAFAEAFDAEEGEGR